MVLLEMPNQGFATTLLAFHHKPVIHPLINKYTLRTHTHTCTLYVIKGAGTNFASRLGMAMIDPTHSAHTTEN